MNVHEYLPLAGRLLIGLPFIYFGFAKAITPTQTLQGIKAVGLPLPPLAFLGAVSLEMIGGALLVLGYQVTLTALLLAVFSIATAVL